MINYNTHFESNNLVCLAQDTFEFFKNFIKKTFLDLVELGNRLIKVQEECLLSPSGKKKFTQWLCCPSFGASKYLATCSMKVANWYQKLSEPLQESVREKLHCWSPAALRHLPKLGDDIVEDLIQNSEKKTEKELKALLPQAEKTTLTPGEVLQPGDWDLVVKKFALDADKLEEIKSSLGDILEPTTDDIVEVLNNSGYKGQKILSKSKKGQPLGFGKTSSDVQPSLDFADELPEPKLYTETEYKLALQQASREKAEFQSIAPVMAPKENNSKTETKIVQPLEIQSYLDKIKQLEQRLEEKENLSRSLLEQLQRFQEQAAGSSVQIQTPQPLPKNSEAKKPCANIGEENYKALLEFKVTTLEKEKERLQLKLETVEQKLEKYAYLELPLSDEQLYTGACVKVIGNLDFQGCTGTVTQRDAFGNWLVYLDYIKEQGSDEKHSYKASQLTFCLNLSGNLDSLSTTENIMVASIVPNS